MCAGQAIGYQIVGVYEEPGHAGRVGGLYPESETK